MVALFLRKKDTIMKNEPKTVYCPRCGIRVGRWDGKTTSPVIGICKKCLRRVIYYPDNDDTELKDKPERKCSSGVTFM